MMASIASRVRPEKPLVALLGHLQIVVVEADEAEAERHRQHDPDIGIERIGPQHGRDHQPGQDHQPAHGRRALLGDQMRLRPVAADRLALALAQPQIVDDPGPEQEHEQRAGHHRAAGAERDVAEHVEGRERSWRNRSANKAFKPPYTATSSSAALPGKRFSSAVTIVFMREPSEPLTMMTSPARIAPTTCDSSAAEFSA